MTTFALVHAAWHGAWCWERLSPLLQRAGHDVVTMDLPSEDGAATFPDEESDPRCRPRMWLGLPTCSSGWWCSNQVATRH